MSHEQTRLEHAAALQRRLNTDGYSEVHHVTPYAKCHTTDVNDLTFGCGGHHPLAEQGWTTWKQAG
jgi:hypothetical protein